MQRQQPFIGIGPAPTPSHYTRPAADGHRRVRLRRVFLTRLSVITPNNSNSNKNNNNNNNNNKHKKLYKSLAFH